jgi:predicted ATP-grasp superfamily ATP-dependent carboligase
MRVFVYEYCCAVGGGAPSLAREGRAMLAALLDDLDAVPGVETVSYPLSGRGEGAVFVSRCLVPVSLGAPSPADEARLFRALAADADATVVIAPESGGTLLRRVRWAGRCGARLLGPTASAARVAGDKRRTAHALRRAGVPTPPTAPLGRHDRITYPAVVKPRDGAGSQATFLARTADDVPRLAAQARAEGHTGELIVQPFVPGEAASVSVLAGPAGAVPLRAGRQLLSQDGRFRYLGGSLPLPPPLEERARELALRAVAAVPGLAGWVGVDVVLGDADAVIEINPRLTTSYLGLRRLAAGNLAPALLAVATGGPAPPLTWRDEEVVWGPDGPQQAENFSMPSVKASSTQAL